MKHQYDGKNRHSLRLSRIRRLLPRLIRSRDGSAAIEFTLLAIPYFLIVFAIFETFIAFTGEQLVANAVDTMGRKLRTGQITHGLSLPSNMTEKEFRKAFCDEVNIMITCSNAEVDSPSKLYLDIRSFPNFTSIPKDFKMSEQDGETDLDTKQFKFNPGGPSSINMFRAYYKWPIITDLVRPYINNVSLGPDDANSYFLIVATIAYKNEAYPR